MKLSKVQKDQIIENLQSYYFDTYHEQLGLIGAENIFSFFMKECAPMIYNMALRDAKFVVDRQMSSLQEELDVLEKR